MVISESTKQGFDFIFTKAAKANLVVNSGDSIEITPLPGGKVVETPEKEIVVLTISSYLFRLLTIFHINPDKVTAAYYSKSETGPVFTEVFSEMANLCCGAMNRDLHNHFPHLGMSTPYLLESKCMPFLKELRPQHVAQHKIVINGSLTMHATLCLCAYAPMDFRVDMSAPEEETGGLEMF